MAKLSIELDHHGFILDYGIDSEKVFHNPTILEVEQEVADRIKSSTGTKLINVLQGLIRQDNYNKGLKK